METLLTDEDEQKKYVYHFVNKYYRGSSYLDYAELESAGFYGLARALKKFDPSKGVKFSTFAGKCIYTELLQVSRWDRKRKRAVVIPIHQTQAESELDGDIVTLEDMLSSEDEYSACDLMMDIRSAMENLAPKQKKYVEMTLSGMNRVEIAQETGIPPGSISNMLLPALKKVKNRVFLA